MQEVLGNQLQLDQYSATTLDIHCRGKFAEKRETIDKLNTVVLSWFNQFVQIWSYCRSSSNDTYSGGVPF
jgi:hypothetical protein